MQMQFQMQPNDGTRKTLFECITHSRSNRPLLLFLLCCKLALV